MHLRSFCKLLAFGLSLCHGSILDSDPATCKHTWNGKQSMPTETTLPLLMDTFGSIDPLFLKMNILSFCFTLISSTPKYFLDLWNLLFKQPQHIFLEKHVLAPLIFKILRL